MILFGLLAIAVGLFTVSGAGFDWEFFMNNHKARLVTSILGRTGARVFYGLLGTVLIVFGVLFAFGIIKNGK